MSMSLKDFTNDAVQRLFRRGITPTPMMIVALSMIWHDALDRHWFHYVEQSQIFKNDQQQILGNLSIDAERFSSFIINSPELIDWFLSSVIYQAIACNFVDHSEIDAINNIMANGVFNYILNNYHDGAILNRIVRHMGNLMTCEMTAVCSLVKAISEEGARRS